MRRMSSLADLAQGLGLHEDVANAGGLVGAGDDLEAAGVGGELIEQGRLAAAADDMQAGNRSAGKFRHSAARVLRYSRARDS